MITHATVNTETFETEHAPTTAKTLAQIILADGLQIAIEFWTEKFEDEFDKMTNRESAMVHDQIEKQINRIHKNIFNNIE